MKFCKTRKSEAMQKLKEQGTKAHQIIISKSIFKSLLDKAKSNINLLNF